MNKKPATIKGFVFRIVLLVLGTAAVTYLFAGPIAFTRLGAIAVIAVLAPVVLIAAIQQMRLRRKLKDTQCGQVHD